MAGWSKPLVIATTAIAVVCAALWFAIPLLNQAPSLPTAQVTLLDGRTLTTAELRGRVAVVHFWATSCTTCVGEMPQMIATYNAFRDQGLAFVAVAMRYDPPQYVENFTKTRQLPFTVARDVDGSAANAFGNVQLTPTTFVVGRDGAILKQYVGEPDWNEFRALLTQALGGPGLRAPGPST